MMFLNFCPQVKWKLKKGADSAEGYTKEELENLFSKVSFHTQ